MLRHSTLLRRERYKEATRRLDGQGSAGVRSKAVINMYYYVKSAKLGPSCDFSTAKVVGSVQQYYLKTKQLAVRAAN